jgi:hypothetical protein
VAEQRIAAAVAAGGIVVDDSQAPSFTVIADQDGNKACVCTSLRRVPASGCRTRSDRRGSGRPGCRSR